MAAIPETHFVRAGEVDIAYQVFGQGPDLVVVNGWFTNLDVMWELPEYARFLDRVATFSRLVMFDKRGTGLSDRVSTVPTLEERADDVTAVMDAIGIESAAVAGTGDGAAIAVMFAATYPERVTSLLLGMCAAKALRDESWDWGIDPAALNAVAELVESSWGKGELAAILAPSMAGDERFLAWFRRWERASATPRAAAAMLRWSLEIDIRAILPSVQAPTLVVHRRDVVLFQARAAKWMAEQIPRARYVEVPGADVFTITGDSDALVDEMEEFLTGTHRHHEGDRVLATVLFTDIVGSTEKATEVGDVGWRDLIDAHHAVVRHWLTRCGGREVDTAGDGFFATFDGPARAIRCAVAIGDAVHELGLEIRAGLHTGEVQQRDDGSVAGMAVHIGARVAALAGANEVLVTSTVKELVIGSDLAFEAHGEHTLKGVPDPWRIYKVV
jgi:pimeloyl-ACP methyl ester carboxylesterase